MKAKFKADQNLELELTGIAESRPLQGWFESGHLEFDFDLLKLERYDEKLEARDFSF